MNSRLEAVIVCVDYSDCLDFCIRYNRNNFDNIVIVTSPKDIATQDLVRAFGINPVITNAFYEDGAIFNKGKAINEGYKHLQYHDWVLNLDADIILPNNLRKNFFNSHPNVNHFFWMKRMDLSDPKDIETVLLQRNYKKLKVMADDGGLGYFQLFNTKSIHFQNTLAATNLRPYPEDSKDASQSDIQFRDKWPLRHIKEIANTGCLHLGESMKNWQGRITPPVRLPKN